MGHGPYSRGANRKWVFDCSKPTWFGSDGTLACFSLAQFHGLGLCFHPMSLQRIHADVQCRVRAATHGVLLRLSTLRPLRPLSLISAAQSHGRQTDTDGRRVPAYPFSSPGSLLSWRTDLPLRLLRTTPTPASASARLFAFSFQSARPCSSRGYRTGRPANYKSPNPG